MARPSRRRGSINHQFRRRVPADVLAKARGYRISFLLPNDDGDEDVVFATVGDEIAFSLRTPLDSLAKKRHAAVLAQAEKWFDSLRKGPRPLTRKQQVALAGLLYRAFAEGLEENPGDPELWDAIKQANEFATAGPVLGIYDSEEEGRLAALDHRFGKMVDLLLQREGVVTDAASRNALLVEAGRALTEAAEKLRRNASGDYSPDTTAQRFPQWTRTDGAEGGQQSSGTTSIRAILNDWWKEAKATGRKPSTYESYRGTATAFIAFLGHDDAGRVSRDDVVRFKDYRLASINPRTGKPISPKTVKDSDLSALKALFRWAAANGRIRFNPAEGVTIRLGRKRKVREKDFTNEEATAILGAALALKQGRENAKTFAAKKWVPWLCAYTGARVGEVAQLRKEDVRKEGRLWTITITPEAGTVKTDEARKIVLHPHLVELGFPEFVSASSKGHLFLSPSKNGGVLGPLRGIKNRLREWVRTIVTDPNVAPNHGWRHTFKSRGIEAGIDGRILDAIQGQAPRTVAETYGQVTLAAMARAMAKFPRYRINGQRK